MSWRKRVALPRFMTRRLPGRRQVQEGAVVADGSTTATLPPAPAGEAAVVPVTPDAPDEAVSEHAAGASDERPVHGDGPLYRREPGSATPLVAQPVIAMRTRPHLRMITWGLAFALVGALATVIASTSMLRLTDTGRLWPAAGNAAAVAAAIAALVQWRMWRLGLREWEGRRDVGLANWMTVSRGCVWLACACAVLTPLAADRVIADSTIDEPAWWLAMGGTACVILGVALAGAHRFRPEGPRGVPPRIRRNHGAERRH